MKPFNLEEAKAGKPLITRSGVKVKEFHCFKGDAPAPVIALLENRMIKPYFKDGKSAGLEIDFDLFMDEEIKIEYRSFYKNGRNIKVGEYIGEDKEITIAIENQFENIGILEITRKDGKIINVQSVHIY
jgi:hypothetical protein